MDQYTRQFTPAHYVRKVDVTYAGKPGHEIVQVYDARFDDAEVYEQPWLDGHESDGAPFRAAWHSSASFTPASPLVPEGLYDLLKRAMLL